MLRIVRTAADTIIFCSLCLAGTLAFALEPMVVPLINKDLTGIDGKAGLMLTVEYPPGGSSPIHRHNSDVFVYVLEGSIVMQVEGKEPMTLGPGQTFYESPSEVHAVSKNASSTKSAKFIVFMVKDKDAPPVLPAR